jgi:hypothetical protein
MLLEVFYTSRSSSSSPSADDTSLGSSTSVCDGEGPKMFESNGLVSHSDGLNVTE